MNPKNITPPKISLPKGGGASSGIGETFQPNAFSGTGSYSIPIPLSPARGFEPHLSLDYNSGSGNGIFGIGFGISIPKISIRTEKGTPKYDGTDVFTAATGELVPKEGGSYERDGFRIYLPRIEGAFSLIKHFLNKDKTESYWEITTSTNEKSIFGKSCKTRICNPDDHAQIFEWLIEESCDSKGNKILYSYKEENSEGETKKALKQGLRNDEWQEGHSNNNKHIKNIKYGNYIDKNNIEQFAFEVVFDYGEYILPKSNSLKLAEKPSWDCRTDPISSFKSGFEIRTYRLCKNILVFHHFKDELGDPSLVKSVSLKYAPQEHYGETKIFGPSILESVKLIGFKRKGNNAKDNYEIKSMPPLNFGFSKFSPPQKPEFKKLEIGADSIPGYLENSNFMPVDLLGEGISGFLCNDGNALMYIEPKGDGKYSAPTTPKFFPINRNLKDGSASLVDIEGNGELQLVIKNKTQLGYYQRKDGDSWEGFKSFKSYPNDFSNKDIEMVSLSSNGKTDLLLSEEKELITYSSLGKHGYTVSDRIVKESGFPSIKKGYKKEHVGFGNILGDGLAHRIKITSGSVQCWPNLGYGKFGTKISLGNAPIFDEYFDASRLHLSDINGSGTLDLIYVYSDRIELFLNESGNRFTDAIKVALPSEGYSNIDRISFSDILGNGTTCLVFTKMAAIPTHYYYDFTGKIILDGKSHKSFKPYLLYEIDNNRGAVTQIQYCSSTKFYLEDKKAGTPWITKLPFPVQLVEKTISIDKITGGRFTQCFKYHDGFYDHKEREFRGFGYVETWDTENYTDYLEGIKNLSVENQEIDIDHFVPPVYTKTWYHTGAPQKEGIVDQHYKHQYFKGDTQSYIFPNSVIDLSNSKEGADPETLRQAYVALHGHVMRTEIYALDYEKEPGNPYSVKESNVEVTLFQNKADNLFSVFMVNNRESISYHYERNPKDPRIEQDFTLKTDAYGNAVQSCKIFLKRRESNASKSPIYPEQQNTKSVFTLSTFVNPNKSNLSCHISCEEQHFELSGLDLNGEDYFSFAEIKKQIDQIGLPERKNIIPHDENFTHDIQIRQLSWIRHYFWNKDQTKPEVLKSISENALLHHSETAVFSATQLKSVFEKKLTDEIHINQIEENGKQIGAGYQFKEGYWWNPNLIQDYGLKDGFYLPSITTDAYKNRTYTTYGEYHLIPTKVVDTLQNTTEAVIDYHSLHPKKITDINGNLSEVLSDPLGMIIATSLYEQNGDVLKGDKPLKHYKTIDNANVDYVLKNAPEMLQNATSYFFYELSYRNNQPPHSVHLMRESHVSDLNKDEKTKIQVHIDFFDGFARTLQSKIKAGPGMALGLNTEQKVTEAKADVRWLTSGRVVYNNKGKEVKKYEPFYSPIAGYESERQLTDLGTTHIYDYDPLLRVVKVTNPDNSFTSVTFTPWEEKHYDENDNSEVSLFYDTPETHRLDNQGRPFQVIQQLVENVQLITHHELDIQGHECSSTDPSGVRCFEHTFDMSGKVLKTMSADAGSHWTLHNAMGQPMHSWDSRGFHTSTSYDELHRPVKVHVKGIDEKKIVDNTVELMVYGEEQGNGELRNMRGKLFQHYDQAGVVEFSSYDIKGKALKSTRRLRKNYRDEPNWIKDKEEDLLEQKQPDLKTEFVTQWAHDALGRVIREVHPDGSISMPQYHPEGWMKQLDVSMAGSTKDKLPFVRGVNYNAKGQRTNIRYGNGVSTSYLYDNKTFRLKNLKTIKNNSMARGCLAAVVPPFILRRFSVKDPSAGQLQDLHYSYDLVGNITEIRDDAQQTNFFKGQVVAPINTYTYDALYRLKSANGREHIGQAKTSGHGSDHNFRAQTPLPTDGQAMRAYTENYDYDASGNIEKIGHKAVAGDWTKTFIYNEVSKINPDEKSNRLSACKVGKAKHQTAAYTYDDHGNMASLPHLSLMHWDHRDQLRATARQRVNDGTPETTWYVYDAAGQRVRQVTDRSANKGEALIRKKERLYLGGFEIYREYKNDGEVKLERETLHIMDDKQRIAMVEKRTKGMDKTPTILTRYQLGNHLNSASLELNENANIISYEEFTPFGSSSYQAVRNQTETSKRYRYSGKERDDATGLYYYGFRYYAPWLCRWMSTDPAGTVDGLNLYAFVKGNPIKLVDHLGLEGNGFLPKIKNTIAKSSEIVATKSADTYYHFSDKVQPPPTDEPGFINKTRQNAAHSLESSGHAINGRHQVEGSRTTNAGGTISKVADVVRRVPVIGNFVGAAAYGAAALKGYQNLDPLGNVIKEDHHKRMSPKGRRNAITPEDVANLAAHAMQKANVKQDISDAIATGVPFGRTGRAIGQLAVGVIRAATGSYDKDKAFLKSLKASVGSYSGNQRPHKPVTPQPVNDSSRNKKYNHN
jgi:RHS repeat-associated protein